MDDYGNTIHADDFFGWVWGPYGLHHWRSIEDDDFI